MAFALEEVFSFGLTVLEPESPGANATRFPGNSAPSASGSKARRLTCASNAPVGASPERFLAVSSDTTASG
jgi:hypothetical protein